MEPVITVKNLNRSYVTYKRGDTLLETVKSLFVREKVVIEAVRDVSFDIEPGTITGLLGENGAGKSTTIKMLTGVLHPTSGDIRVLGYVPFAERARYVKHIGAVFGQKSQLIWDIPPADSFRLNMAVYGILEADYRRRLDRMIGLLNLGGIVEKPTRVLSLGERMKCEFIMCMLHAPRVVFLDEPTIGLDVLAKDAIRDFIRELNREGVTFILTTHDLADVESLAHRVIIINRGRKVFEDSLGALKRHLGNKKNVRVVMNTPLPQDLAGITVLSRSGDREAELLIDMDSLPMSAFLARLSGWGELKDIAIEELGIETVIKAIYENK